jgi:hypothetical protein
VWLAIGRTLGRWFFRSWRRNFQRVTSTTAALALVKQVLNGKPQTVFRGSLEPGAGIQIRLRKPGEP